MEATWILTFHMIWQLPKWYHRRQEPGAARLTMTSVDSGKGSNEQRGRRKRGEGNGGCAYPGWQTAVDRDSLCQGIFFYTLNDDSHPSPSDNCIKTSCKTCKAQQSKICWHNQQQKRFFKYFFHRKRILGRVRSSGRNGGEGALQNV